MCTVLLVDDHAVVRQGLRAIIEKDETLSVVAEADNGRDALQLVKRHRPDVVIMDIAMPELNGIDATCEILEKYPRTHIICLSMYEDRRFVVRMLKSGAKGYILKDSAVEELLDAIHMVRKGRLYVSSHLTAFVTDALTCSGELKNVENLLTLRERELLQLIAEGYSSNEISERLIISPRTVETHRKRIMKKLDVHNIAELTRSAIREGLINP